MVNIMGKERRSQGIYSCLKSEGVVGVVFFFQNMVLAGNEHRTGRDICLPQSRGINLLSAMAPLCCSSSPRCRPRPHLP